MYYVDVLFYGGILDGKGQASFVVSIVVGAKIMDYCLFNPTVEGAWINQRMQKLLGPLRKTAYILYCSEVLVSKLANQNPWNKIHLHLMTSF